MYDAITQISDFIIGSFFHIWPYLLVTIPLAVAVQMSGASRYIKRAFQARPISAILLATVLGAFSPFCSCGVIPVIASLLISGVPLAPVMSFWIASPSMDPEIFFLSVGMIGWELAVWRLVATLVLSFSAGLITQILMDRGWLGRQILQSREYTPSQSLFGLIKKAWSNFQIRPRQISLSDSMIPQSVPVSASQVHLTAINRPVNQSVHIKGPSMCTSCEAESVSVTAGVQPLIAESVPAASENGCCSSAKDLQPEINPPSFQMRLLKETLAATWMVAKFMALAFLLEGLIILYVPERWITGALGSGNPLTIVTAALLGVPAYTTSLAALPMIGGLLNQGMNPAAALAFLIAGPVTTLPAMAAVWPLVVRRVFVLYVLFALGGAVIVGYIYNIMAAV